MGLFEGVAEGEQAGFTERGADERQADGQHRVRRETCRDDQVGPAGDVRQNRGARVNVVGQRDAFFLDQAWWARRGGDDKGVEFLLGDEPRETVANDFTAVVEGAEVGLILDGEGFLFALVEGKAIFVGHPAFGGGFGNFLRERDDVLVCFREIFARKCGEVVFDLGFEFGVADREIEAAIQTEDERREFDVDDDGAFGSENGDGGLNDCVDARVLFHEVAEQSETGAAQSVGS